MPNNIYIIMGLSALLGLLLLWRGMHNTFNSDLHKVRGLLQLVSAGTLISLSTLIFIACINLNTYKNLNQETPLASIEFEELKHEPGRFIATLSMHDGLTRRYELKGDQWQIDARIIKWGSTAIHLGLKPLYQLERLSGRYSHTDEQNAFKQTANELLISKGIDIWELAQQFKSYLPFIDASYGSATYQSMQNGLQYDIFLTNTALITKQKMNIKNNS